MNNFSGSVVHNGNQFNYQPVNPQNPVQGMKLSCVFHHRKVTPQDIKVNIPEDVLHNCFVAAGEMYKELYDGSPRFNGSEYSTFIKKIGGFICNKIINERYMSEVVTSPNFEVKTYYPSGKVEAVWTQK